MKNPLFEDAAMARAARQLPASGLQADQPQITGNHSLAWTIPDDSRLGQLLGFDAVPVVGNLLTNTLLRPVADLTSNPGKCIRAQLVSLSYRLLNGDRPLSLAAAKSYRSCAAAIELVHAGSLIIDDIEDGSPVRRGHPALHTRYGVPLALNAGNWLYFWPVDLLKESGLNDDDLRLVYEHYHRTLLRAHFGQALDLGARVDALAQDSVTDVCLASMRLKTGALMGFAALLGAVLADSSENLLSALDEFGRDLGVALQMFDDLGNVLGKCEPLKRYEDLRLSRPSWVWACAAQNSSPTDYQEFVVAARALPKPENLEKWLERHGLIDRVRQSARIHLNRSFANLKERLNAEHVRWSACALDELYALGEKIAVAYE